MPQTKQPPPRARQIAAAYATARGAQAAGQAATIPPAAAATGSVALGVTTAGVMSAFITWLAEVRRRNQAYLARRLARHGKPGDVAKAVQAEMLLEQEFAMRAANRLATKMPTALVIADPAEREAAVRQILADEERFARQRSEAMLARALAALTRSDLRSSSPLGAFWKLGHAQQHTEGCLRMAGRFWPWAVLDRVHPPRHYGCTSSLHGYHEAVGNGLMRPEDVPDVRAAVRAAAGVMMEGEADRVLAELDVRDRLEEMGVDASAIPFEGVSEAFDEARHPRGFHGRFRRATQAAAALKAGKQATIDPADAPALVDALADGKPSSLHKLEVAGHPNLFRAHARELSRGEMPQIPKVHLPGFMDFLRSKRVGATVEEVSPSRLQATQNQVNGAAVAAMAKGWDPARGGMMMVSSEYHVLDGHHRWASAALHGLSDPGYKVQALKFSAGTDRMLGLMREYNAVVGEKPRAFGAGAVPKAGAA